MTKTLKPGPSAEHWRAVREALEKTTGAGQWKCFSGRVMPEPFDVVFDRFDHPENAAGVTALFPWGVLVCLRSDMTPGEVHRTALHEFAHVADVALLRAGYPTYLLEHRARLEAERLARL